jgi:cytochrome c biogenesis protein CcmG, thiol:disulfide interchange protein DsbE
MKYNKLLSVFIIIAFITVSSVFAQNIKEGSAAPDFTLTLSTGKQIKLSDYKGKAVLLHFWATWCPPCRAELPEMNKLAEKITTEKDAELSFLAVCVSDEEKSRAAFMKKNNFTFTGGVDKDGSVARKYEVQGIPTSILISADGKIEKIQVGAMSASQLADFVSTYEKQ